MSATWRVIEGDCRESLRTLDAETVQTCVTSPPYFGLRDYGHDGQLGLEATPDEYVASLVDAFREVRRVLAHNGTLWLNLGDSYANPGHYKGNPGDHGTIGRPRQADQEQGREYSKAWPGAKNKDLIGIPWRVAFALQADGWYLRSHIVWVKPNPMPEPVTDRPTSAHESVFLFAKSARYFYDADAIREPFVDERQGADGSLLTRQRNVGGRTDGYTTPNGWVPPEGRTGRNRRNVWVIPSAVFADAHFATFPPKLVEPCILAGSREGDTVLDPFAGSGTTGMVALRHGRAFVGCELSAEYVELARRRIVDDAPLLNSYAEEAVA